MFAVLKQWLLQQRETEASFVYIICIGLYTFCFCFLFIFSHSCRTNYLNIYWTDLRRSFRVGRTMAVNDESEVSVFNRQRTLQLVVQPGGLSVGLHVSLF